MYIYYYNQNNNYIVFSSKVFKIHFNIIKIIGFKNNSKINIALYKVNTI